MGNERFIDWQLGTQAAFDKVAPLGLPTAEPMCRRPGLAPWSEWSRAVVPPGQRIRVGDGQSAATRFARLSNTDKLGVALRSAAQGLGPEVGGKLRELISPTNLAIMAGALAIWVGAQATPIGWIVDIGMVGLGVVALGAEAVHVMRELHAFAMGVIRANNEVDLMKAGGHLAKAVAIVGVDVVVAILLKKAIVKVRQPAPAHGDGAGEGKLFGKYDPKDAVKSLPKGSQEARGNAAGAANNTANVGPKILEPLNPGTRFYVRPDGQTLDAKTYTRNSGFRSGVRDKVWDKAVDPETGLVKDPLTGTTINKSQPWDMGHRPGMEYWKERNNAINKWLDDGVYTTRKEFLDKMNDPSRYRPELPLSNRGHRLEDVTDDFWD